MTIDELDVATVSDKKSWRQPELFLLPVEDVAQGDKTQFFEDLSGQFRS